jgi:ribosomal protein L37AE/L43A
MGRPKKVVVEAVKPPEDAIEEKQVEVVDKKKYEVCPLCEEKKLEIQKDGQWFSAECHACTAKTNYVKNEYMLNYLLENKKLTIQKV